MEKNDDDGFYTNSYKRPLFKPSPNPFKSWVKGVVILVLMMMEFSCKYNLINVLKNMFQIKSHFAHHPAYAFTFLTISLNFYYLLYH